MVATRKGTLAAYRQKRNFRSTEEPRGGAIRARVRALRLVIQKHDASHLHYDLRLELDGVMKSWAVPKGPSNDPTAKRLAMQVEDHPVEYNSFEGTIPKGSYGGGTVMLWDRGTYEPLSGDVNDLRAAFKAGSIKFTALGERMKGEWALVRMQRGDGRQWLLIKHRDRYARVKGNLTGRATKSITTGRTMREIAAAGADDSEDHLRKKKTASATSLQPMLAKVGTDIPVSNEWAFEPKYDGIRILAYADGDAVNLMTRNHLDKSAQFPEIVDALAALSKRKRRPVVLDGEVVALVGRSLGRFQALQERIHEKDVAVIASHTNNAPATLVVFDLLLDGAITYVNKSYAIRRHRLERLLAGTGFKALRLGESHRGNGERLLAKARQAGWEGIMAKRTDSTYQLATRSPDWLKLKLEARQEFVVGGWTEPKRSREHLGAVLLGYWKKGKLIYAGHTGGGFTRKTLQEMRALLAPLEIAKSPFTVTPRTNAPAHWTRPRIVVEVKFNEWTEDGSLRQPILLGIRDDKKSRTVVREAPSLQRARRQVRPVASTQKAASPARGQTIVAQLRKIEDNDGGGTIHFPGGKTLDVSHLDKIYFPGAGYTKGDVMRYYASVAAVMLPLIADRPLVLKRYPEGINADSFFQQNAPMDAPTSVRVVSVKSANGTNRRIVGGGLPTLLYTVQLGAIDVHPWLSRVKMLQFADFAVLDLDPMPRARFDRVKKVALWIGEILKKAGYRATVKTSGSRGLHIFVPMPAHTKYKEAQQFARTIATEIAEAHPREVTVQRLIAKRPAGTVYVDFLQNAEGKSVAAPFSLRAKAGATVSMPIAWNELNGALQIKDFTIENAPAIAKARAGHWRFTK